MAHFTDTSYRAQDVSLVKMSALQNGTLGGQNIMVPMEMHYQQRSVTDKQ